MSKYKGANSRSKEFKLSDYLKWHEYPYYWVVNAWDNFRYTFPFERHDLAPPGTDTKYLIRWTLWRGLYGRALYLHHIVASDWAGEPHDHPKTFTSIGLWGSYTEETYSRTFELRELGRTTHYTTQVRLKLTNTRVHTAPWIRQFPAPHTHRLMVDEGKSCWTLVYVGHKEQDWGFYKDDGTKVLYVDYMRENFG